ncbi:hypothetical protein [Plantactinospora endophytica]|uniref:Uncharacterized protein n=1 Tax=Plantactinospora endophytica TaxID=673535 RepID=A0ABQ4DW25_9ACTN|nr:hypothetical protein [Plantactinospora endophytica]GIG86646.1 hypothetical protein Pen02_15820 [Plantactinospora endophytica]
MTGVPVVVCRACDGLTFTVDTCVCTYDGDRLFVEGDRPGDGTAYRDCQLCQGVGRVARPCRPCGQTGRRRAQLVLTMANVDTGAVASANVVPGVVEPAPWPGGGDWHLPLAPLVRELAAAVGAGSWRDVRMPNRSPDGPVVFLPRRWKPGLPEPTRRALEAAAIAAESGWPWYLLLGRTAVDPPRDLAADLGRWCRLADLLYLDLVVEARRRHSHADDLSWSIRYEIPGGAVPAEAHGWADDLPGAIAATTLHDAMYGLIERGRAAPAHYLAGRDRECPQAPSVDLDQLERRIVADCTDVATGAATAGAQAVWRDGRWWHTSLRTAGTTETFVERSTGQIACRQAVVLRRGWQPPAPDHPSGTSTAATATRTVGCGPAPARWPVDLPIRTASSVPAPAAARPRCAA